MNCDAAVIIAAKLYTMDPQIDDDVVLALCQRIPELIPKTTVILDHAHKSLGIYDNQLMSIAPELWHQALNAALNEVKAEAYLGDIRKTVNNAVIAATLAVAMRLKSMNDQMKLSTAALHIQPPL